MFTWENIGQFIGGLGLFLVGIELMRQGLKDTAGGSLKRLLHKSTSSTKTGIIAGVMGSSISQSSSAIIITLINFLDVRIIRLRQSLNVALGANLGKITTAWLIATLGLKLNLSSYAYGLLALGLFIKFALPQKSKGYGLALVGLSIVFLGIHLLKSQIALFANDLNFTAAHDLGVISIFSFIASGILLSAITQSSSAALVIIMSAAQSGIISIEAAMAIPMGFYLGTSCNTIVVGWRSTPVGRRLALWHILFNIHCMLIGTFLIFSLKLLGFLPSLVSWIALDVVTNITIIYSAVIVITAGITIVNLDHISEWLKKYFHKHNALSHPVHLRDCDLASPVLAKENIKREILRLALVSNNMLQEAFHWKHKNGWVHSKDLAELEYEMDLLNENIHQYAGKMIQENEDHDEDLELQSQTFCRASQHFGLVSDFSHNICKIKNKLRDPLDEKTLSLISEWCDLGIQFCHESSQVLMTGDRETLSELRLRIDEWDKKRRTLRHHMIQESMNGKFSSTLASSIMDSIEMARRALKEFNKGTHKLWTPFHQEDKSHMHENPSVQNTTDNQTPTQEKTEKEKFQDNVIPFRK